MFEEYLMIYIQLAKMNFDKIFDLTAGGYLNFYNIPWSVSTVPPTDCESLYITALCIYETAVTSFGVQTLSHAPEDGTPPSKSEQYRRQRTRF